MAKLNSHEHIQCLSYDATIWTFQSILYILTVSSRFSHNLKVAINGPSNLGKISQNTCKESSFSSKVKIKGMLSRLSEYVSEDAV